MSRELEARAHEADPDVAKMYEALGIILWIVKAKVDSFTPETIPGGPELRAWKSLMDATTRTLNALIRLHNARPDTSWDKVFHDRVLR